MNHAVAPKSAPVIDGKKMEALINSLDWSKTSLGTPDTWQTTLQTSLRLCMNACVPIFIWWGDDLHFFYNDACEPILGEHYTTAIGTNGQQVFSDSWEQVLPALKKVLYHGDALQLKKRTFQFQNANDVYFDFALNPILENTGDVCGIFCFVTENKESPDSQEKIEAALRANEERYRAFVSQSSEAIWRFELEEPLDTTLPPDVQIEHFYKYGYLAECNDVLAKMYAYEKAADIIGARLGDLLPASDATNVAYLEAFIAASYRLTEAESNEIDRDGQPRHFLNNLIGIVEDGWLLRAWGTQRDITKHKQTETALRENERNLRLLTDAMPVLISYVDKSLHYRFVNRHYTQWFSLEKAQIEGKHTREVLGEAAFQAVFPNIEKVLSGQEIKLEQLLHYKNAGTRFVSVNYIPDIQANGDVNGWYALVQDITERKQNEEKLRERENELHTLANTISQLAWMADPDGYIFWYNERWYEYTGTTPTQMAGWGWQSVHDPDMLPLVVKKWKQSLESGEPFEMEFPLRGADGVFRWYLTRINPLYDLQGNIIRWFGTNTDIDELRRMRETLLESERQLQHLANAMPQVVWIANPEGIVTYYNNRVLELDGISKTETNEWHWEPMVHPDDLEQTSNIWQHAVQTKSNYSHEHRLRLKDGSYRWHLSRAFPILDSDGNLTRWYGTATDIDNLKRTQQELAESQKRFQDLADTTPILIWQAGIDKNCYYFNRGWLEFTGRTFEQEQGTGWTEGIHPDDFDHCLQIYFAAFEQREAFTMEYRLRYKDGNYRWIFDRGVPTYDSNGNFTGFLGGCIDIEEKKIAEAQKDAFIRIAGHELRTPLTSLLGYLNLIQKNGQDQASIDYYVKKSYASSLKMRGLINDFLHFSSVLPGQFSFKLSTFHFDEMVAETIENIRLSYPHYRILITGETAQQIHADHSRIEQVIYNLINNAIKYSPKVHQVEIALQTEAESVMLSVSDHGIGIAPEELEHIFDRFYRASNTGKIRGMGLGLFIVKEIIDFHQGTISVESQTGIGTTFTITLPIAGVGTMEQN